MKTFCRYLLTAAILCIPALLLQDPAAAQTETVLHSFGGKHGQYPAAGLTAVKGTLYGTTEEGGAHQGGTLFALNPKTGKEKVIYSFCSQQNCTDGKYPIANLVEVNGMLFGTTGFGGTPGCNSGNGCGTAFAFDPATGAETVLHAFGNGTDGWYPTAGLIDMNGTMFGTSFYGGANGGGTVFSIDPNSGAESVIYSFCSQRSCTDGASPQAGLISFRGKLYGTTWYGGSTGCGGQGCGTVFSVDTKTGTESVLHVFGNGTDGINPAAALINVKGMLYGTTSTGGSGNCSAEQWQGCGTVFAIDPKTEAETVLYSFCSQKNCADGVDPLGTLIQTGGMLYGTTYLGGGANAGTIFALDPDSGTETILHSFAGGADGERPQAGVIGVKGNLYGTTAQGGAYGSGIAFVLTNP